MTIVDKIIASIQAAVFMPQESSGGSVVGPTPLRGVQPPTPPEQTPISVYYHDDPTLNMMTSTMTFPCAIVKLLSNGNIVREGGQAKERVTAAVFFVDVTEFDFDAVENERIIDACKQRALTWIGSLNTGGTLNATVTRTQRVYDQYDDILTGYGLSVDIIETSGFCLKS